MLNSDFNSSVLQRTSQSKDYTGSQGVQHVHVTKSCGWNGTQAESSTTRLRCQLSFCISMACIGHAQKRGKLLAPSIPASPKGSISCANVPRVKRFHGTLRAPRAKANHDAGPGSKAKRSEPAQVLRKSLHAAIRQWVGARVGTSFADRSHESRWWGASTSKSCVMGGLREQG